MPKRSGLAVFIDRDGTVCFDRHYLSNPNELEFIPTVAEGIKKLKGKETNVKKARTR